VTFFYGTWQWIHNLFATIYHYTIPTLRQLHFILQIFNAHNQRGCYGRAKIGHHPELLPFAKFYEE